MSGPMQRAQLDFLHRMSLEPVEEFSLIPTWTDVEAVRCDLHVRGRHLANYVKAIATALQSHGADIDPAEIAAQAEAVFDDLAWCCDGIAARSEERERTYAMEARG